MSKYMKQGNKDMDVGVKAPMSEHDTDHPVLREAKGKTVGIMTSRRGAIETGSETFRDGLPKGGK